MFFCTIRFLKATRRCPQWNWSSKQFDSWSEDQFGTRCNPSQVNGKQSLQPHILFFLTLWSWPARRKGHQCHIWVANVKLTINLASFMHTASIVAETQTRGDIQAIRTGGVILTATKLALKLFRWALPCVFIIKKPVSTSAANIYTKEIFFPNGCPKEEPLAVVFNVLARVVHISKIRYNSNLHELFRFFQHKPPESRINI